MPHKNTKPYGKRWIARVKEDGKQKQLGTFDTKDEAAYAELQWRRRNVKAFREDTCDGFAARWMDDYPRKKESTTLHNKERVRAFAKKFAGELLRDVDRPTARKWALKNPTQLPAIRAMFNDALLDGYVDSNPFAGLRIEQSTGRRDIEIISEEKLNELAQYAHDRNELFGATHRAIIMCAAYMGVRPGELFALGTEDIDGDFVHVRYAWCEKTRKLSTPKNGKSRMIVLPPQARKALAEIPLSLQRPMFRSPTGKQINRAGWLYHWREIRLGAGLPKMDFYELRHYCATWLRQHGASWEDIAIQLGHTDKGELARKLYCHPDEEGSLQRLRNTFASEGVVAPVEHPSLRVVSG